MKEVNSRFNLSGRNFAVATKGVKATNDTEPTMKLLGIPNKFQLNRLATSAMGLSVGDRIKVIVDEDSEDMNQKFFLAKSASDDETATKLAPSNSSSKHTKDVEMVFSMAGIWSRILQNTTNAVELGNEVLAEKGLVTKGTTSGGKVKFRSNKDVVAKIEFAGEVEIEEVTYELYAITDFKFSDIAVDDVTSDVEVDEDEDEDDEI